MQNDLSCGGVLRRPDSETRVVQDRPACTVVLHAGRLNPDSVTTVESLILTCTLFCAKRLAEQQTVTTLVVILDTEEFAKDALKHIAAKKRVVGKGKLSAKQIKP